MADRIHPYQMFPQSLTPNSLQQSQIPQQQPQSQQPDPQMISALSNPEQSRMWQQMNQLQTAYRSQQSADLTASQMNHQMQEFARGQALSHGQGQPIVQQIQQSFGLNTQRINPPVFHDSQASQPSSLLPSVPMGIQQQVKAPFNMNPMMHGMNNPGVPRQLKMLSPQDIARLQQQSGIGNQPAMDMFIPPAMQHSQDQLRGSPHPSAQSIGPPGPNVPGNPQQGGAQKRMITPAEFQERRNYLLSLIKQSENNLGSLLQSRNATPIDPLIQQQINQFRAEINKRKEVYNQFVSTFGAMVTQQIANGMSSNMPMNPMGHPTSQPPQQPPVPNASGQPGFVPQPNQSVATPYNMPAGNGPSPLPTQGQGTLNQQIPVPPSQIVRPNTIPPRTGGTPHQISGGQLPNAMSPNIGNFAAQGGQKIPNQVRQSVGIMPLDKLRFESTYAGFCRSQNINPGQHVAIGESRSVDLHQLHVQVMHENGAKSVTQRDMWAVIGGRLGFIQFPGNDSEPARCGPGIAQQLQNTYDQYLQRFENAYILTVKNRPANGSPQPQMPQMNSSPLTLGNSATPGMPGNPTEMPPNPSRPLNQQVIAAAARFAHLSAEEMRVQRVQEPMIAFVERHRSELQKLYQQQVQLLAKRNAEQEQQNMVNAQNQLRNMQQPPFDMQLQRSIGPSTMVSMPTGDAQMVNGSFVPENATAVIHKQPPTQDQIQHAMMSINQFKNMFQTRLPTMHTVQVPDEQRLEYNQLLEQVYKMTSELDAKLHMYFAVFRSEDLLRKYVAIVLTVARQRQLLSTSTSQYIIAPNTLRTMHLQLLKLNEEFENRWRAMKAAAANVANSQHHPMAPTARLNPTSLTVPPVHNVAQTTSPASQTNGRPVSVNPPPPPQPHPSPSQPHLQPPPPTQSHPPNRPQSQSHPQPPASQQPKKPFLSPSPSVPPIPTTIASPPPAVASSSTPATSAPTPQTIVGSPQTPKSPPSRVPKVRGAPRPHRGPSMGKAPATPEATPPIIGFKRPPEEDVTTFTNVAPSEAETSNAPSPKKAKTEWEGETSEALLKKQQALDNIKTEEDAAAFFDQMKELLLTASTDNEINHDIASTLDQILAGVAQEPADAAATAAALSVHGAGDAGPPPTALSPHMGPAPDAFLEFLDFSSFTTLEDEDNDSKAPTPDLVSSSETNPSPESGSEGDLLGGSGSPDKTKIEESADPLRLGSLKEIDGGESAYYQIDNWKWEGPMHTLEQPWAIFTS